MTSVSYLEFNDPIEQSSDSLLRPVTVSRAEHGSRPFLSIIRTLTRKLPSPLTLYSWNLSTRQSAIVTRSAYPPTYPIGQAITSDFEGSSTSHMRQAYSSLFSSLFLSICVSLSEPRFAEGRR